MDTFSLEDDDCHELFITQSSNSNVTVSDVLAEVNNNVGLAGESEEKLNDDVNASGIIQPIYEDISDSDFDMPPSPVFGKSQR